jgi:hypothetical protein
MMSDAAFTSYEYIVLYSLEALSLLLLFLSLIVGIIVGWIFVIRNLWVVYREAMRLE